jgi:hypothetical protein
MDQIELGRWFGRLEATMEDHGRRLSRLEQRRPARASFPWKDMLPVAYGLLILAIAYFGKGPIQEAAIKLISP